MSMLKSSQAFALIAVIFLASVLTATPAGAVEYSVGVAPPVVEMDVQKGESRIVRFYIVTPSEDPLTVYLEPSPGTLDFFNKENYRSKLQNFSEEDVQGWTEIFNNPVELLPTDVGIGFGVRGSREINFLLNVPQNAEPGYHVVNIRPTPAVSDQDLGTVGASIVAITTVNVLFRVEGEAVRRGEIFSVSYRNGKIETDFRNTGTVTITAMARHKIYSDGGAVETSSQIIKLRPGESNSMEAPFSSGAGEYRVETSIDYRSNSANFNSTIFVTAAPAASITAEEQQFPWWIAVVVLIILISIFIYKRAS